MTIERPGAIAAELQADLEADARHARGIVERAIDLLNDYQRFLDQPNPVPTPASIPRPGLPTGVMPPAPPRAKSAREDHERSVENARRLDETVDRRAAATAAARILSGQPQAAGAFDKIYDQVLARLREGKTQP